jgi:hypothetical protein
MVSIPISNDDYFGYFWSADVDGFRFPDGATPKTIYTFQKQKGVFTTGSSCISGPSEFVSQIRDTILADVSIIREDAAWGKIYSCTEWKKVKNFSIRFGSYWIQVDTEDILTSLGQNECGVCLTPTEGVDYWVLGLAAMRHYYTSYDFDKLAIDIAPSYKSEKPQVAKTETDVVETYIGEAVGGLKPGIVACIVLIPTFVISVGAVFLTIYLVKHLAKNDKVEED